jgi:ATP-dependent DNA helicase RecQ
MIRKYFIEKSENGEKTEIVRRGEERRLARMIRYAETSQCRRGFILDYFAGRHVRYRCGECDNCRARGEGADAGVADRLTELPDAGRGAVEALEWTRMALSCIERIRRAGAPPSIRAVAAVLMGRRAPEVREKQLDRLSTWNLLSGWRRDETARLFRTMKTMKLVSRAGSTIELTELGRNVMRGRAKPVIVFERDSAASGLIVERAADDGRTARRRAAPPKSARL